MTFALANFKEAGGPGNSQSGGQVYSIENSSDSLVTMMASGYMDAVADSINTGDVAILSGSDGVKLVRLTNTAGVITMDEVQISSGMQSISGPGAVDIVTPVTEITTTGADAFTLADGAIGQKKTVVLIVDGGNAVLTPANALGYTTITFADAGDSVSLEFRTGGWAIVGQGGLTTGPLSA